MAHLRGGLVGSFQNPPSVGGVKTGPHGLCRAGQDDHARIVKQRCKGGLQGAVAAAEHLQFAVLGLAHDHRRDAEAADIDGRISAREAARGTHFATALEVEVELARKGAKHLAWILLSLGTGLTFVAYFQDVTELVPDFYTLQAGGWVLFWVSFFTRLAVVLKWVTTSFW